MHHYLSTHKLQIPTRGGGCGWEGGYRETYLGDRGAQRAEQLDGTDTEHLCGIREELCSAPKRTKNPQKGASAKKQYRVNIHPTLVIYKRLLLASWAGSPDPDPG